MCITLRKTKTYNLQLKWKLPATKSTAQRQAERSNTDTSCNREFENNRILIYYFKKIAARNIGEEPDRQCNASQSCSATAAIDVTECSQVLMIGNDFKKMFTFFEGGW